MVSAVDRRRLVDGERAVQLLSEPEPTTLEKLVTRRQTIFDGALALQSLDDLGSPEANQKAWDDMMRLQRAFQDLDEKITALKAAK